VTAPVEPRIPDPQPEPNEGVADDPAMPDDDEEEDEEAKK